MLQAMESGIYFVFCDMIFLISTYLFFLAIKIVYRDIYFANFTNDQLIEEIRRNALSSEVTLNIMIQKLRSANQALEIASYWSGPFFRANNYGYRYTAYPFNIYCYQY
jgi:hypothetical protein